MPLRLRKLIGALLILAIAIIYALVATTVAVAQLGEASNLMRLLFFGLTGLLWIVPAMFIIKWMHKTPKQGTRATSDHPGAV